MAQREGAETGSLFFRNQEEIPGVPSIMNTMGRQTLALAAAGWLIYALFINPIWADYRLTFEDQVRHALAHLAVGVFLFGLIATWPRKQVEDSDAAA